MINAICALSAMELWTGSEGTLAWFLRHRDPAMRRRGLYFKTKGLVAHDRALCVTAAGSPLREGG